MVLTRRRVGETWDGAPSRAAVLLRATEQRQEAGPFIQMQMKSLPSRTFLVGSQPLDVFGAISRQEAHVH